VPLRRDPAHHQLMITFVVGPKDDTRTLARF